MICIVWQHSLLERPLTVYPLLSSCHVNGREHSDNSGLAAHFLSTLFGKSAPHILTKTFDTSMDRNWSVFRQSYLTIAGTFTRCTLLGQSVDQLRFLPPWQVRNKRVGHTIHLVNYCTVHRMGTLSWYVAPTFSKGWVTVQFRPIFGAELWRHAVSNLFSSAEANLCSKENAKHCQATIVEVCQNYVASITSGKARLDSGQASNKWFPVLFRNE